MLARVTTISVPPEELTEELLAFRRRILERAGEEPGFRGALDLVDRASGRSVAITLWDSEEALRASERAARPPGAAGPTVEVYEVALYRPAGS